jgi:RNA polymerase sigma-70 factor (ECF subfamily)
MEVELTDEAHVQKYRQSKDLNSFSILVRRYQNRVFNAAYRMLGSKEEAEEVVQDTFIKIHQGMDSFRSESTFAAWVFRISHNLCIDTLRSRKKRSAIQLVPFKSRTSEGEGGGELPELDDIPDSSLEPAQQLDVQEESAVLEASLKSLPESQRAVLVLHDLEGFQYQEISEIIGASIGTVRSRLHYGRIKLKEILDAYYSAQNQPITPR